MRSKAENEVERLLNYKVHNKMAVVSYATFLFLLFSICSNKYSGAKSTPLSQQESLLLSEVRFAETK
jgi:hypothetical protein